MILIRSSWSDISTSNVIDWITYLSRQEIVRVNDDCEVSEIVHTVNSKGFYPKLILKDGRSIDFSQVCSIWYRRGHFRFGCPSIRIIGEITSENITGLLSTVEKSNQIILNDLERELKHIKHLNSFDDININKLSVLAKAVQLGLRVPDTLITNNTDEIYTFCSEKDKVITKSLTTPSLNLNYGEDNIQLLSYTNIVTKDEIEEIINSSSNIVSKAPSFFQEYIEKEFEIRSFFIEGEFYSMAIFSQSDYNTRIDCRMESANGPLRCVPFKLPSDVEDSLIKLAGQLNLNCGSFDILYSTAKEFVFLEVNPIGQFDWLAKSCNYFIDKIIAKKLTK
jgi:ATP-GRASP peptide maturase of grasp-with-spasm system